MLQIVLLAGKFVFLIVLYLFIYRVIRSSTRELRMAAPAAERQQWSATGGTYREGGEPAAGAPSSRGAGSGVWTLVVQKSPCIQAGTAYSFPPGARALAGRSSDTDIHLEDTFVSSKHVLFETTANGLEVEDLRSTNGTQVNGTDISDSTLLREGDRVEVGDTVFQVQVR